MGRQIIQLVQVLVDRLEDAAARQQKDFRHLDEEIERRKAAEKDRDHWRQARQDAMAAGELMQAEIETLKGAMAADDQRLRDAEERVWPGETRGCDAPDAMADEILHLRQQLRGAHAPAMAQQSEEIAYLRARLDEERSVIASLRQQLAESQQQDVGAMRAEVERLQAFVGTVQSASSYFRGSTEWHKIEAALAELDAQPAPVAETAEGAK